MKITNILYDFLLEEVRDIGTYNFLLRSWYGENPTDEQKSQVEDLVNKYTQLKGQNRLRADLPIIVTFLERFRGFPVQNLTQPRTFTLDQMKFLVREYFGGEEEEEVSVAGLPDVFKDKDLINGKKEITNEIIEQSKNLWFGDTFKIVDEGNFRVYEVPDRSVAAAFGIYLAQTTRNEIFANRSRIPWCITNLQTTNSYQYYRESKGRTFYFTIDESKDPNVQTNPNIAQYYLCAVQHAQDSPTGYRLTSILNDGSDPVFETDEIVNIYPKLGNHINKIVKVDYSSSRELGNNLDPVDLVTEMNPNSEYYFPSIPLSLKLRYISVKGKPVSLAISWRSMTPELKTSYIEKIDRQNLYERVGEQILDEIKKNRQELKSLDARLRKIGLDGLKQLALNSIKNKYRLHRTAIKNDNIVILKTFQQPRKYGIYDISKMEWVTKDGITFKAEYNEPKATILRNKNNKTELFYCEIFNKSSQPADDSFVSIYNIKNVTKTHVMTYKSFLELKENYDLTDETTDVKPEIEKHTDIEEMLQKKGI